MISKFCVAILATLLSVGSVRADLIQIHESLVNTEVLRLVAGTDGTVMGTVGQEAKKVGEWYDSLPVTFDLTGERLSVSAGMATWVYSKPEFGVQAPNGFTLKSPDWNPFTVFLLGVTTPAGTALVGNPTGDVSYLNTPASSFVGSFTMIFYGDGQMSVRLTDVLIDLTAAQQDPGTGTGTASEPGSMALAVLALITLIAFRRVRRL